MTTIESVPNQPREGRSSRTIRLDDDDWADLQAVAEDRDLSAGWLLRHILAWWLGRPGAEMPDRPASGR